MYGLHYFDEVMAVAGNCEGAFEFSEQDGALHDDRGREVTEVCAPHGVLPGLAAYRLTRIHVMVGEGAAADVARYAELRRGQESPPRLEVQVTAPLAAVPEALNALLTLESVHALEVDEALAGGEEEHIPAPDTDEVREAVSALMRVLPALAPQHLAVTLADAHVGRVLAALARGTLASASLIVWRRSAAYWVSDLLEVAPTLLSVEVTHFGGPPIGLPDCIVPVTVRVRSEEGTEAAYELENEPDRFRLRRVLDDPATCSHGVVPRQVQEVAALN